MCLINFMSFVKKDKWWLTYGSCATELHHIIVKVLSQTVSASNCKRNQSIFNYIHTKTRNRLNYQIQYKLVFTFYNMKFKMSHMKKRSQEDIENNFNPINLDYIFQKEDSLLLWLQERDALLLDGIQNVELLLVINFNDKDGDGCGGNESSRESPT